jgi:hypothetical protein
MKERGAVVMTAAFLSVSVPLRPLYLEESAPGLNGLRGTAGMLQADCFASSGLISGHAFVEDWG